MKKHILVNLAVGIAAMLTAVSVFTGCEKSEEGGGGDSPQKIEIKMKKSSDTVSVCSTLRLEYDLVTAGVKVESEKWTSEDVSIATVAADSGVVTGVKEGAVYIRVSVNNQTTDSCKVIVTARTPESREYTVKLDTNEIKVYVRYSSTLTATVNPSEGANVEWKSGDAAIASVVGNAFKGKVKGGKLGETYVYCIVNGNEKFKDSCKVTVVSPPFYPVLPDSVCVFIDNLWWAPVNCGYDNEHTYGLLYQWGRLYGQPYEEGTITPTVLTKEQGESSDYKGSVGKENESDYNWFSGGVDNNLWNGSSKGAYDPCPTGWRVPTKTELENLIRNKSDWKTLPSGMTGFYFSGNTAYSDTIPRVFLPASGFRDIESGNAIGRNEAVYYWLSSADGTNAWGMYFYSDTAYLYPCPRAVGCSVRCVKE